MVGTPLLSSFFSQPFLTQHWPSTWAVEHGPVERLAGLHTLPALADVESLLPHFHDRVRAALEDKRDEHSSVLVEAEQALELHHHGLALIFDRVERFLPEVERLLHQLRVELGLPRRCNPRCIVYASPPGSGNSPHFDANANFVVQLQGSKLWRVAPNHDVVAPTDRWAMNQVGVSEELESYVDGPLPRELPSDATTVELQPGSVLFVPRGMWHETEAHEPSLALNFTFGQPTWADVITSAFRARLIREANWRGLALDVASTNPKLAEAARRALVQRLATAVEELAALDADAVLEFSDSEPAFECVPEVERPDVETPELNEALEWMAQQPHPFTAAQVSAQVGRDVDELLAELVQTRWLRRCRSR